MTPEEKQYSVEELNQQLQRALRRAALIYHYFCETLTAELGDEQGYEMVRKAVDAYGDHVGKAAKHAAEEKGLSLDPENFQSDLPDTAWKTETVIIDGEKRVRVHHCPLAAEWMEWGDPEKARLYCYVDQAKMKGFNPEFQYVHIKNLLDGDPYCELAIRPVTKDAEMVEKTSDTVSWVHGKYEREDLLAMDVDCLRALFRERIHHKIEVLLYPVVLGEKEVKPNFGREPELILSVWKERGLPEDEPDIEWGKKYISLAKQLRDGKSIQFDEPLPAPPGKQEAQMLERLMRERRSTRNWIPDKSVPDEMIERILEAGRAAPTGCNLDIVRFVVIRDPEAAKMVWSDIPTPTDRCALIVICYDKRIYKTVGHDRLVPHNQLYDCAAAADHMCLMAHALGLGAVWLTCTKKTARTFKDKYGLPDHIEQACHMAVGWPAVGTIKSARMPLDRMIITKQKG